MKRALGLLLLAAGCAAPEAAPIDDLAFELAVAQQVPLDLENAKVGDWVVYSVRREGDPRPLPLKYAVVAEDRGALWIENRRHTGTGDMVVKSKFDRAGKLLEQWVGEPGGAPGQTFPHPRRPEAPAPRRDPGSAQADLKEEQEVVTVRGKAFACTKITTTLRYPGGRQSVMASWFSRDVPLGPRKYGGLVKRQFGRFTMELVAQGVDARPELTIPR